MFGGFLLVFLRGGIVVLLLCFGGWVGGVFCFLYFAQDFFFI